MFVKWPKLVKYIIKSVIFSFIIDIKYYLTPNQDFKLSQEAYISSCWIPLNLGASPSTNTKVSEANNSFVIGKTSKK